MKLNLEEMREIARTLPIGYYLGRKVPVFVEDGNSAYCDVVKGDVHIGVGLLQIAADHIDAKDAAEWDRETLLRCLLYHEIGHLLLTPKWCKTHIRVKNQNGNNFREDKSNSILNIFEDERLERVLERYFMGVKFRKFVKLVCKGEGKGRRDDVAKIYRAIRLRDAAPDVCAAVDAAIKNLADMNAATPSYDYERYFSHARVYASEVNALVKKILDAPKEEPGGGGEQQQQQSQQSQSESEQGESEQGEQGESEQGDAKPAPQEQPEQDEPKDDESGDKSEDDSEAEENSGGEGDGGDGSDGESDKPDEEDSEGDEGEGDADGDGDADADGDDAEGESKSDGDGDQGDGDESDEDSDGDAKYDGDDADDADDAGDDNSDGGVDGDDGEDKSLDGDAAGDEADAGGTDDTEDAEDSDGETSCAVSGVLALPPNYLKEVADKVFATPTSDIENVLRRFAQRIAKQKGAQAAGRWSALTGRIDPRRDAQDKDRIFRRSSDVGDAINTAVHLTLWVDVSGSFKQSEPLLNQILAATYRAMKMSGGKLDVDVVKMDVCATVAGPDDWQIVASGGNNINYTYVDAWRKTRRKNKRNIDVVVFDGEACCYYGSEKAIGAIVRQIWDSPDCHLVIDRENEAWAEELKRAHVTLLTGNYAESLRDEVVKLLDRIL